MNDDELARLALDEAKRATALAHEVRNELNMHTREDQEHHNSVTRRVDRIGWDVEQHKELLEGQDDRVMAIAKEQEVQRTAMDRLAISVDRLAAKLPPTKTPGEHIRNTWGEAKTKTKVGVVLGIITALSAPEVLKEIFAAIGRLLAK